MSRIAPILQPLVAAALLVAAASPATAVTDAASPEPPLSSIAGQVWDDVDGDGLRGPEEPPVPGVTVELWTDGDADGALDTILTTTATDGDGRYRFDGLDPSVDHGVRFVAPVGRSFTGPDVGDDGVDSDADPASGLSDVVGLQPGEAVTTVDAGLAATEEPTDVDTSPPTTPITGRVWSDEDADGLQDEPEPGVPDVEVHLWTDDDGDGAPDTLVSSTTTGDGGGYVLAVPDPALRYLVEFDDGEPLTAKDVGTDDAIDSDPDPATGFTDVIAFDGATDTANVDAGMLLVIITVHPPATWIGGRVWLDEDADGIQDEGEPDVPGIAIDLWADVNGDGRFNTKIAAPTATGADGRYLFEQLDPSFRYVVLFGAQYLTVKDAGTDDTLDSDPDPATGFTEPIDLVDPRAFDPTTIDAGIIVPDQLPAWAFGRVWEDEDGDGIQDEDTPGVPGVTVEVWTDDDGDGEPDARLRTTTTDADGRYGIFEFEVGRSQDFYVRFVAPAGFAFTTPDVGDDDAVDSDADPDTGFATAAGPMMDAGLVRVPVAPAEIAATGAGVASSVAPAVAAFAVGIALLIGDRRRVGRVRAS